MKDKDDELSDFVENENKAIREFPKKVILLPFRIIKYLIEFLLSIIDAFSKTSKVGFAILILAIILILQLIQFQRMNEINTQLDDLEVEIYYLKDEINLH